ncbi:MAG TPA: TIGR01440 family protein [Firmicutes bacterium]|nr:TIGR01440 family protein [Bacillota bacterium]
MNNWQSISEETACALVELEAAAGLCRGQILVVGCSTSEVGGQHIGTAGSAEVAQAIMCSLLRFAENTGVRLAIQCCEHLNRALVVEEETAALYGLEIVSVIPVCGAGGALAAQAMQDMQKAVVVESIRAHAGLDIGETLIGMHLRAVAVPLRLSRRSIGQARISAAKTRPKLIGGPRAVYE